MIEGRRVMSTTEEHYISSHLVMTKPKKLALDRRKTVADLKDDVVKLVGKGQGV